jgi:glucokinase
VKRKRRQENSCTLGIDIGGTKMLLALYDRDFRMVAEDKVKTSVPKGRQAFRMALAESIAALKKTARRRGLHIACVGVGCACRLDPHSGRIVAAVNIPFLEGYPLARRIEKMAGARVHMVNDVQAGLYGEFRLGAAVGARHVIAVFVGTGLGGALIIDGRLYDGASGFAGDIGNYLVHAMRPQADAAEKEVLDNVASRRAIAADAAKLAARHFAPEKLKEIGTDGTKIKSKQLASAVRKGDKTLTTLVRARARVIGVALSNLVDFINPDTVILGGGLVEALPHLVRQEIVDTVKTHSGAGNLEGMRIKVAALGGHAVAAGAARLALDTKGVRRAGARRPGA